ncbi:TetR/AcrR family transcriptional regulator [Paenibacillus doosanensis]|uniref:TetR/AcrR family transcriptional regulator n=1 Tax=Paenibacillus doosanensis TaxID=1229154 RepID=UPI00217FB124|nr:TetR/AcrR family transcriptional regulator [Paenibacillus doosanensis]MCS7459570.1 TetR/AcrR family transcriptional regulator [Paenibacillus doosanensis]
MARPRDFDRQQALERAMHIFWSKGYEGATMPDLLEGMGVSRSSLYNAYGDKLALFHEVVAHYRQTIGESKRQPLLRSDSAKQCIRSYLQLLVDTALSGDGTHPGGCLFTNLATSLETADESVRQTVLHSLNQLEQQLYDVLERGRQSGEIAADKDIRSIARMLLGLAQGINVVSRASKDREQLEGMVRAAMTALE